MKKSLKAFTAVLLAAMMCIVALPIYALPSAEMAESRTVPTGYNANDYTKTVEFLEKTDENGVKNGDKVFEAYNPNDPRTWEPRFHWLLQGGEYRLQVIDIGWLELCGGLDVSDCTALVMLSCAFNPRMGELNVRGCTMLADLECLVCGLSELDVSTNIALKTLACSNNAISEIDVSAASDLEWLSVPHNRLTSLDVSHNPKLNWLQFNGNPIAQIDLSNLQYLQVLDCGETALTELDVSHNPELNTLNAQGNRLRELDLSSNPLLAFDHIRVEGNGFVGYGYSNVDGNDSGMLHGYTFGNTAFEGFFDGNGALIDAGTQQDYYEEFTTYEYQFEDYPTGDVTVRFEGAGDPVSGDVDGDGSVTTADALSLIRYLLGVESGANLNLGNADMDANGDLTIADAVLILRAVMGI